MKVSGFSDAMVGRLMENLTPDLDSVTQLLSLKEPARRGAHTPLRFSVFNSSGARSEESIPLMPQGEGSRPCGAQTTLHGHLHTGRLRTSSLTSDGSSQRSKGVDSGNSSLIDSSSTDSYPDLGGGRSRTTSTTKYDPQLLDRYAPFNSDDTVEDYPETTFDQHEPLLNVDTLTPEVSAGVSLQNANSVLYVGVDNDVKKAANVSSALLVRSGIEPGTAGGCDCRTASSSQNSLCSSGSGKRQCSPADEVSLIDRSRSPATPDMTTSPGNLPFLDHSRANDMDVTLCPDSQTLLHVINTPRSQQCLKGLSRSLSAGNITSLTTSGSHLLDFSKFPGARHQDGHLQNTPHSSDCSNNKTNPTSSYQNSYFYGDSPNALRVYNSTQPVTMTPRHPDMSVPVHQHDKTSPGQTSASNQITPLTGNSRNGIGINSHSSNSAPSAITHYRPKIIPDLKSVLGHGAPVANRNKNAGKGHATEPLQVLVPRMSPDDFYPVSYIPSNYHQTYSHTGHNFEPRPSPSYNFHSQNHTPFFDDLPEDAVALNNVDSRFAKDVHLNTNRNPFSDIRRSRDCPNQKQLCHQVSLDHGQRHPHPGCVRYTRNCESDPAGVSDKKITPSSPHVYDSANENKPRITFENLPLKFCCRSDACSSQHQCLASPTSGFSTNLPTSGFSTNLPTSGFSTNQTTSGFSTHQPTSGFSTNLPTSPRERGVWPDICHQNYNPGLQTDTCKRANPPHVNPPHVNPPHVNPPHVPEPVRYEDDNGYKSGMVLSIPLSCFEPDFLDPNYDENAQIDQHLSTPSSLDSGQARSGEDKTKTASQLGLLKAGTRDRRALIGNASRDIPDYRFLCLVAAIFNPLLGLIAFLLNSSARRSYLSYCYNRANNLYLATITVSTSGIFLTLIGLALLVAHLVAVSKPGMPDAGLPVVPESCREQLVGYDDHLMKFYKIDLDLFCKVAAHDKMISALKHYQLLHSQVTSRIGVKAETPVNSTSPALNSTAADDEKAISTEVDTIINALESTPKPDPVFKNETSDPKTETPSGSGVENPGISLPLVPAKQGVHSHNTIEGDDDLNIPAGLETEFDKFQSGDIRSKLSPDKQEVTSDLDTPSGLPPSYLNTTSAEV
ncbi:uncharacterized protein LOC131928922 [Physella acuta]|uniref:uncharacterized protein LOC131928922 n=1 Tax=Physella acuta TaxID=109671 RepID=UPI0027DD421B|nr:uncharacterized protein LOC131928922 [Physella acuta]XP_059141073.1 uncharacterized protein LOC131928922 [Physella acuta]